MKSILIIICAFSMVASCKKPDNCVAKPKSSYTTDSLKMEEAIKTTMKKMHL